MFDIFVIFTSMMFESPLRSMYLFASAAGGGFSRIFVVQPSQVLVDFVGDFVRPSVVRPSVCLTCGHFWGILVIFGEFLGNFWGIFGQFLLNFWGSGDFSGDFLVIFW